MPRLRPSVVTTVGVTAAGVILLALAGCSMTIPGSAPATSCGASSGSSPATSPATAPSAAPAAKAAAPFTVPTTCPSAAEMASTLGIPTPPDPHPVAETGSLICSYLSATQGGPIILIQPDPNATQASIEAQVQAAVPGSIALAPLSGLGDTAYSISKDGVVIGVFELRQGTALYLESPGTPSLSGLETMARKLRGA
ncbi:MAG: hypothetical protein M3N46_01160 [Actinomycetota bacterium]|nr:hypothetical protein [Actinomycetota bacterium]